MSLKYNQECKLLLIGTANKNIPITDQFIIDPAVQPGGGGGGAHKVPALTLSIHNVF